MTEQQTLAGFVAARLEEDEKAANAAAGLCGCHSPAPVWTFDTSEDTGDERIVIEGDAHADRIKRKLTRRWRGSYEDLFHAEYITRFDPARVLREVTAKRAILAAHADYARTDPHDCIRRSWYERETLCWVIRQMAAAHSNHEDYRTEWDPEAWPEWVPIGRDAQKREESE